MELKKNTLPVAMASPGFSFSAFSSDGTLHDFDNVIVLVRGVEQIILEHLSGVCGVFGVFILSAADLCVAFLIADLSRCRLKLFGPAVLALATMGVVKSIKCIDLLIRPRGVGVVGDLTIANDVDLFGLFSFWSIGWNAVLDGDKQILTGVPGADCGLYAADSRFE